MAQPVIRTGRPLWLELNAQRVTEAVRFYQELFAWSLRPLHVPPWGAIPIIANGDRPFANQFMAMGAFAVPHWKIWFAGDLPAAETAIKAAGGDVGQGIHLLEGHGHRLDAHDPAGRQFALIDLVGAPPEADRPGDPCLAEYWGPDALALADFYASALGLDRVDIPTGAMLTDDGEPCLFLRRTDFEIHPPRWIPYFRTASVGGDLERARRAGAIRQVYEDTIPHLGELVILADPAGAFFGLVDTSKA